MIRKLFYVYVLVSLICAPARAQTPAHVNGFGGTTGGCGGSGSCIVNISVTSYANPNWLIVDCSGNANTGTNTITSSSGSVINRTTFNDTTNFWLHTFATITGATTGTVTVTCTGTNMFRESGVVDQYSNISAFDAASSTTWAGGTVSTSVTATAITTTTNGDLCEGVAVDEAANGTLPSATAPFTYTGSTDGIFPLVSSYDVQTSAGSISSAWTGFNAAAKPVAATICLSPTVSGSGGGGMGGKAGIGGKAGLG